MIRDPHENTSVEFALGRTVVMNGASQETPIRPEKTAGMRMFIGKGEVREYLPLILIYAGSKLGPCRNRLACELKRPDLVIDDNVISQIHTAGATLPAGKRHQLLTLEPSKKPGLP
jgi:hypothetical protein